MIYIWWIFRKVKFLPISSKVWQEVLEKYSENLFYDICQENNFGWGVIIIFLKKEEMAKFYVMESMRERFYLITNAHY